jgi:hypothetical protein
MDGDGPARILVASPTHDHKFGIGDGGSGVVDITSESAGTAEQQLEELERQVTELTREWVARLVGEIDAVAALDDTARRAGQVGQVLESLNRAQEGIARARAVLR